MKMLTDAGHICEGCGTQDMRVTDSRPRDNYIYRRRQCSMCGLKMSTVEIPGEMSQRYEMEEETERALARLSNRELRAVIALIDNLKRE